MPFSEQAPCSLPLRAVLTPNDTSAATVQWYGETEASCLCCSLCLQSSERLRVSGEPVAPLQQPGTVRVESHRLLLFLLSSSFVWLCSSCAPQRQPQGEKGKRRGERESCSFSHLCQALRLSSSGSLLCLCCFPRCLKLQLPGAHRYHWGGSAYDVLIIRFAITSGREADLLFSKLRKRE